MKKFEVTNETMTYEPNVFGADEGLSVVVHRIKALVDIPGVVKAGQLGGWVEKEENLSHKGTCWIFDDATVIGNALVSENAKVFDISSVRDNARVYGNACVKEESYVLENARVFEQATLSDNAVVVGKCQIYGKSTVINSYIEDHAQIFGNARVVDSGVRKSARIYDNATVDLENGNTVDKHGKFIVAEIGGNADIHGNSKITGFVVVRHNVEIFGDAVIDIDDESIAYINDNVKIFDNVHISGNVKLSGDAFIYDSAKVSGNVKISDNAVICGNTEISGKLQIGKNVIIKNNIIAFNDNNKF